MTAEIAASWDLASRLIAAHPYFRIFETHPGGVMQDRLKIACSHASQAGCDTQSLFRESPWGGHEEDLDAKPAEREARPAVAVE